MLVRRAVHALRRPRPAAARHALRGGFGHCPVLVPDFRRMGPFARLQNLAIDAFDQDRDGCFLVGAAALDSGRPLASGIQPIVCTEVVHSLSAHF